MDEAIAVLRALAQALTAQALYAQGHTATKRSEENLWQALSALLAVDPHPVFLLLGTAPVYAGRALHDLRDWQHSARLAAIGVQQLEFDQSLTADAVTLLVDQLSARLAAAPGELTAMTPIQGVVFGYVALQDTAAAPSDAADEVVAVPEGALAIDLIDELDAMQYIRTEAARGAVARSEAEALVRFLATLIPPRRVAQAASPEGATRFGDVHPVNTALLAMSAATASGVSSSGCHDVGVAALLHNIGMAMLPAELSGEDEGADPASRTAESHPVSGARLLLRHGGPGFEFAAVVAFEHHLQPDGAGYPVRRFAPATHWASGLVGCCAAFAALRTSSASRPGWPVARALDYISERSGTVFDPEMTSLLARLVHST